MVTLTPFYQAFSISFTPNTETDLAGYMIHACHASELVEGDLIPTLSNLINKGPETSFFCTVTSKAGMWYVKVAAYDTFGTDELTYSGLYSVNVPSFTIMPDELFSSLRVDFFVQDTIFRFNLPSEGEVTTLLWTAGSIIRGENTYTLDSGYITNADDSFLIATLLDDGTATLSVEPTGSGVPELKTNQIIVAVTSATPLDTGNYVAYVRQANSMMLEGAAIRDATISTAKIISLTADKITTGDLVVASNGIGALRSAKASFDDATPGFWIGADNNNAKLNVGNSTEYLKFDSSTGKMELSAKVILSADSTISYSQISDTPDIPALPSYVTSTKITSTSIESPNIIGGTLSATSGTFTGELVAATGTFYGQVSAGSIDFTKLVGKSYTYNTGAGTYYTTIPDLMTCMRITMVGGGGGGASGRNDTDATWWQLTTNFYCAGGGGGGGGGVKNYVLTGLTPGDSVTVIVGAAGQGGISNDGFNLTGGVDGTAGGDSVVLINGQEVARAYGGGGGKFQGTGLIQHYEPIPSSLGWSTPYDTSFRRITGAQGASGGYGASDGKNGGCLDDEAIFNENVDPDHSVFLSCSMGGNGGNSMLGTGGQGGYTGAAGYAWSYSWGGIIINNTGPWVPPTAASGYGAGGAGGGSGAAISGASLNLNIISSYQYFFNGTDGSPGYAAIEFYNPEGVVLRTDYDALVNILESQGHTLWSTLRA